MRNLTTIIEGFFNNVGADPKSALDNWYKIVMGRGTFPGDSTYHCVADGYWKDKANHNGVVYDVERGKIIVRPYKSYSRIEIKSGKFEFNIEDVPEVLRLDPKRTLAIIFADRNYINFLEYTEENPNTYCKPSGKNVIVCVKSDRKSVYYDHTVSRN